MNHAARVFACSLLAAVLSVIFAAACTKNTAPEENAQPAKSPPTANEDKSAAAPPARAPASVQYARTEGPASTTVAASHKDGAIEYVLTIKSERSECNARIEGMAREKEGDMESRDDDQGNGHFVAEYVEEGEACGVSVSIDLETKKLAWVEVWDCKAIAEGCPGPLKGPLTVR